MNCSERKDYMSESLYKLNDPLIREAESALDGKTSNEKGQR